MANTGNIFPGTGESVDRAGLTAWTTPGNIVSDNTTDATCNAAGSDYLVARNFDFSSIPDGATIVGILVRVEASEHTAGTEPLLAQLQDEAAALVGSSKSTSNEGSISGTAKAVYTYGSTSDLWGATLTPAIVKDADFGVRLWFTTSHDIRIDFVTMQIEYTVPAGADDDENSHWGGVALSGTVGAAKTFAAATLLTMALAGKIYDDQVIVPQQSTRLYPTVTHQNDITPAYESGWSETTGAVRSSLLRERSAPTPSANDQPGNFSGAVGADFSAAHGQLITRPMLAGIPFSTSDRIKFQSYTYEHAADSNANRQPIALKIVSRDGTVVRAILKSLGHYGPSTTEYSVGVYTNRTFADNDLLEANYTTVNGDRLVLEYGAQVDGTGSTNFRSINLFHAHPENADLPEDESTTTTPLNTWFEISVALNFEYAYEDDTPVKRFLSSPWLAPQFIGPQHSAEYTTIVEDEYLPPRPWPQVRVPPILWDNDEIVTVEAPTIVEDDSYLPPPVWKPTQPPLILFANDDITSTIAEDDSFFPMSKWPQQHKWLTQVDDEIASEPPPAVAFEDEAIGRVSTGQPWLAPLFLQPQDSAQYVTVVEDEYWPCKVWPDKYNRLTFNGDDEVVTPPTPFGIVDEHQFIGPYKRLTYDWVRLFHSDEVPTPAAPLGIDLDTGFRILVPRPWLSRVWVSPQPYSDPVGQIFVEDSQWDVNKHKPYVNKWYVFYDPQEYGYFVPLDSGGWVPSMVWPQVTTLFSEPSANDDARLLATSITDENQPPLVVWPNKIKSLTLYQGDELGRLPYEETGGVFPAPRLWWTNKIILHPDPVEQGELSLTPTVDEEPAFVSQYKPQRNSPILLWGESSDSPVGIEFEEQETKQTAYQAWPWAKQPFKDDDNFISIPVIVEDEPYIPNNKWNFWKSAVFTDDGNAVQYFQDEESDSTFVRWPTPAHVKPFLDDDVVITTPAPLQVDEEYFLQLVSKTYAPYPHAVIDDDVIASEAPPIGVDEVENAPLPRPNHWWTTRLYWWDDLPWAQNISLAPARLDAIVSEVMSQGNGPPNAELSAIVAEVLYQQPPLPVRITYDQVSYGGVSDAEARVTREQVEIFGTSPAIALGTWDHVDFMGWQPAGADVTWLHVDILITPGGPEPEPECPTTPFECLGPTIVPFNCEIVVVQVECGGVGPQVVIDDVVDDECPPIMGLPIPSGEFGLPAETTIVQDNVWIVGKHTSWKYLPIVLWNTEEIV